MWAKQSPPDRHKLLRKLLTGWCLEVRVPNDTYWISTALNQRAVSDALGWEHISNGTADCIIYLFYIYFLLFFFMQSLGVIKQKKIVLHIFHVLQNRSCSKGFHSIMLCNIHSTTAGFQKIIKNYYKIHVSSRKYKSSIVKPAGMISIASGEQKGKGLESLCTFFFFKWDRFSLNIPLKAHYECSPSETPGRFKVEVWELSSLSECQINLTNRSFRRKRDN